MRLPCPCHSALCPLSYVCICPLPSASALGPLSYLCLCPTSPSVRPCLFLAPAPALPGKVLGRVLQLVDLWLHHFDSLGAVSSAGTWHRKLVALALVSLAPAAAAEGMLSRLDQVLDKCVDVLSEIEGPAGQHAACTVLGSPVRGGTTAAAVAAAASGGGGGGGGQEAELGAFAERQRAMLQGDAVLATDLRSYLQQKMHETQAAVGAEAFQQAMGAVDPAILGQLFQ